jgi:hypothetical protein
MQLFVRGSTAPTNERKQKPWQQHVADYNYLSIFPERFLANFASTISNSSR